MANKYELVRSYIDDVRQNLRETSDDSHITDEQIYKALIDARGLILERRLKKGKQVPAYMYQEICIPVCLDTYHDCDCVPTEYGCTVLKTKYELPNSLYNGTTEVVRVSTLFGKEIAESSEALMRLRKYRKTGHNNYYYVKVNNRLALFNIPNNRLKGIKVKGIFFDPVTAAALSLCPDDQPNCVDPTLTGFGVGAADNLSLYELVMKKLSPTKQLPDDRSNDADSTISNQEY